MQKNVHPQDVNRQMSSKTHWRKPRWFARRLQRVTGYGDWISCLSDVVSFLSPR